MKRTRRLYRRLLYAAVIVCMISGELAMLELWDRPRGDPSELVLSLVAVLGLAGAIGLSAGLFEAHQLAFRLEWDWLFNDDEQPGVGTDWERWPRPPRQRALKPPDEPPGSAFWMKKLASRYARLERFEELMAPEPILEMERRLIRKAIAQLSPENAIAVMRSWKDLDSAHMKKRRKAPPAEGSN